MKKGLAIVLAAATAFTFAPVANLAAPVVAEAASDNTSALSLKYDSANDVAVPKTYSLTSGLYKILVDKKSSETTAPTVKANFDGEDSGDVTVTPLYSDSKSVDATKNYLKVIQKTNHATNVKLTFTLPKDISKPAEKNGVYTYTIKKIADVQDAESAVIATGDKNTDTEMYSAPAGNNVPDTIAVTVTGMPEPTLTYKDNASSGSLANVAKTAYGDTTYDFGTNESLTADFTAKGSITKDGTNSATAGTEYSDTGFTFSSANGFVTFSDAANKGDMAKGKVKITRKSGVSGTDTITVSVKTADGKSVYASTTLKINLPENKSHISSFTWTDPTDGKLAYLTLTGKPQGVKDADLHDSAGSSSVKLDALVHNTLQLNVVADSALTFTSSDKSVATVSSTGLVTALKPGSTTVKVYAASDLDAPKQLTVNVTDDVTDTITAKVNNEDVDDNEKAIHLDPSTSTAATAVKTAQIDAKSAAGSAVAFQVLADEGTTVADSAIANVSSTGLVTAGTKTGTVYVKLTTPAAQNGKVKGGTKCVKVVVEKLPQADITMSDLTLDLKDHKTATLNAVSTVKDAKFAYVLDDDAKNVVDVLGNTVTAKKVGEGKITVSVAPTATTRYTEKTVKVSVVNEIQKKASDLKVTSAKTVALTKGASSQITYTVATGSAVSFESSDPTVATVSGSSIQALKAGTAIITVKTPETDKTLAGSDFVVVTVTEAAVKPAKVTGVKVSNKKGAKVSVSWTSQDKNINYRVYKKVGNGSWKAKNVAGNKTTLSVKKGAKVTVKVKAYVKDANGKTTWGPKATQKSLKTDKK
ncbi:MAG: Ig-like domain-containing protein [Lachnospiraceae bacterium]|nr:Ig-like domain-containing protein [Lachnospiraceae bacterium]